MRNPRSIAAVLLLAALARGQITFEPPISITHKPDVGVFGSYPIDLDGDGREELVLPPCLFTHTTSLEVIDVDGEGQLSVSTFATTNGTVTTEMSRELAFFDNDGDGDMDILHAVASPQPYLEVYRTTQANAAEVIQVLPIPPSSSVLTSGPQVKMGDVTGDGLSDALVAYSLSANLFSFSHGELALFEGRSDGTFVPGVLPQSGIPDYTANRFIHDINGDGLNDIVLVTRSPHDHAVALMSLGNGTFAPAVTSDFPPDLWLNFLRAQLFDITNDGQPDLVTSSAERLYAAQGHSDGTFDPFVMIDGVPPASSFKFVQLNDDDAPDLVIRESNGSASGISETFQVLSNQCNGSFAHDTTIIEPLAALHTADIDGNGLDDPVFIKLGEIIAYRTATPGISPFSSVGGGSDDGPTLSLTEHSYGVSVFVDGTISGEGYIFAGTEPMNRELYGATLVPDPVWSSGPVEITNSDGWNVVWPALETLPPGATLWVQAWVAGETSDDIVASDAIRITVP